MLRLAKDAYAVVATAVFVTASAGAVGQRTVPLSDLVGQTLTGQVVGVVDGDTIDVRLYSDRTIRVRLEGIDAPSMGAPFSADARNQASTVLFEKTVVVHGSVVDRADELVARVIVNGRDASRELVRHGVACVYHGYLTDAALASAQSLARTARDGFWRFPHSRPAACPVQPAH